MSTIDRRLKRLEVAGSVGARQIVVFSGGASDEEVFRMLASDHGIVVDSSDQLIHFATIYLDRDGHPDPNPLPPRYTPTAAHRGPSRAPRA